MKKKTYIKKKEENYYGKHASENAARRRRRAEQDKSWKDSLMDSPTSNSGDLCLFNGNKRMAMKDIAPKFKF